MATTSTVDIGAVQRKESGSPAPNTSYVDIGASQRSGTTPPPAAYCYRRTLTVDHTQCGTANSTDFPVVVRLSDATFKTVANGGHVQHTTTSNGQTVPADLNFYSDLALTTPLNYETESYDPTTGDLVCWVKLPTLSHTADTVFYMAYGDAGTTTFQGNVNGTWNSNFKGVWHLPNGSSLAATDSTAGAHTGTITGPAATAGTIDGGASFPGSSTNTINFGASADWNFAGGFTVSLWMKIGVDADGFLLGIHNGSTAFAFELVQTHLVGGDGILWAVNGASTQAHYFVSVADGNWHQIVGTWNSGTQIPTLYVDGAFVASGTASGAFGGSSSIALTAGNDAGGVGVFGLYAGTLDELHAANALLSTDWITSEFNNQMPSSTFFSLSGETFLCGNAVKSSGIRGWSWGF
jgi:hypothetical protein